MIAELHLLTENILQGVSILLFQPFLFQWEHLGFNEKLHDFNEILLLYLLPNSGKIKPLERVLVALINSKISEERRLLFLQPQLAQYKPVQATGSPGVPDIF